jgi:hypothetical protein
MKLREKTEDEIMSDLTPFGFVDDGDDIVNITMNEPRGDSNWIFNENF